MSGALLAIGYVGMEIGQRLFPQVDDATDLARKKKGYVDLTVLNVLKGISNKWRRRVGKFHRSVEQIHGRSSVTTGERAAKQESK